jgi:trans-feruloyl-CoA hydratase/vanillin synthase
MNPEMNLEIMNVLDAIEIDERAKALVLTGAGDSFSAGMDLKEFFRNAAQESSPERLIQIRRHFTTLACW